MPPKKGAPQEKKEEGYKLPSKDGFVSFYFCFTILISLFYLENVIEKFIYDLCLFLLLKNII